MSVDFSDRKALTFRSGRFEPSVLFSHNPGGAEPCLISDEMIGINLVR
jgi:hypothetical protein